MKLRVVTLRSPRLRAREVSSAEVVASVKAVAHDLGFADPFTFSRAFKRVTGRSPRAWIAG